MASECVHCDDCKFWSPIIDGATEPDDDPIDGECRRHAPVVVKYRNPNSGFDVVTKRWPQTVRAEWCGDGVKRE